MRRGEGAAPGEDSGRSCHLALTQGESGTYSLTDWGGGAGGNSTRTFFSPTRLCIVSVLCSVDGPVELWCVGIMLASKTQ